MAGVVEGLVSDLVAKEVERMHPGRNSLLKISLSCYRTSRVRALPEWKRA